MKTFIIINGLDARLIKRYSIEKAIESAVSTCDHSQEIIVREIKTFKGLNQKPHQPNQIDKTQ